MIIAIIAIVTPALGVNTNGKRRFEMVRKVKIDKSGVVEVVERVASVGKRPSFNYDLFQKDQEEARIKSLKRKEEKEKKEAALRELRTERVELAERIKQAITDKRRRNKAKKSSYIMELSLRAVEIDFILEGGE